MATREFTRPFRLLCVGDVGGIANATAGKGYNVVQAADCDDALRLIAEQGADVLLVSASALGSSPSLPLEGDPEAVRKIGELLTMLSRTRTEGT